MPGLGETFWEFARGVAAVADVEAAAEEARRSIDRLLWNRGLRARQGEIIPEVRLGEVRATLFIDGIDLPERAWRSGSVFDDSPMGRAAAGAWRVEGALGQLAEVWRHAPIQALARAHVLLAGDLGSDAGLGRPRRGDEAPDDPLRLGPPPAAGGLADAIRAALPSPAPDEVPAVVEAALAHGELLALRPFAWGSGLLARLASRLVMASRGVDADFLVATDVALAASGRPAYVRALRGYIRGRGEGRASPGAVGWVTFFCDATVRGARWTSGLV